MRTESSVDVTEARAPIDLPVVVPVDAIATEAALQRLNVLTKPLGALGRLESIAAQVAGIQGRAMPALERPHVVVFAGDHGAADQGVSAYPKAVTAQMVVNFLAGGAAINVLALHSGLELLVVDAGVDHDFPAQPRLLARKIRRGTRDYTLGPAMTAGEVCEAVAAARATVAELAVGGCNTLVLGEMGIGNTGSATLLMHGLTGRSLDLCVGRGTGLDDAGLSRKLTLLSRARVRAPQVRDAIGLLVEFGGYEIAMLTGAVLEAAHSRMLIVVDGFTVTVAVALAARLEPLVLDYCVFGHRSAEQAHGALLRDLGAEPLLDLGLRLGEGTGGALAVGIVRAALELYAGMATFATAGVSGKVSL